MTVAELNSQLLGAHMDPIDFFLYISTACVIGVWIFLLSSFFGNHQPDGFPFGMSKETTSRILMFAGLFMAFMVAIKFLLL